MIELIGIHGTHEYDVACKIRDAMAAQWPGIDTSPAAEELITIAANAKLSGYQVSDIDVVVGAVFNRPRHFVVRKHILDKDGRSALGVKARVQNFFGVIEVKGQPAEALSFQGDEINVRYKGKWKSATDQNVKQLHALSAYFEHMRLEVFVYRTVALDGIDELRRLNGVTQPATGAVASSFSAGELIASMVGINGISKWNGEYVVSSCRQEIARKAITAPIFQRVVPTQMDRLRMDRIISGQKDAARLAALLGKQRVHIRGHGGTGKTVLMLQAAHLAYEQHGRRCLILTYNTALAGDIRRLLAMLGVPSSTEGGGVEVKTAMAFIMKWISRLGLKNAALGVEEYEQLCGECIALIDAGAITQSDISAIIDNDPDEFGFDALIVDEGQDWPQLEAHLLTRLYGPNSVSIADGREQLLRGRPTNWQSTLEAGQICDEQSLTHCLRMKRNLGVFANTVASLAGLNWQIEPNDQAAGGRVLILRGRYGEQAELVSALIASAQKSGNEHIDLLHCVPPADVVEADGIRRSKLALTLEGQGLKTWDAVDERVRAEYPRSPDLLRVLQYDSVRGLEGWVTVLEQFEEAFSYKTGHWLKEFNSATDPQSDPVRAARLAAWRWCMIPLTRPMDTLVITWTDELSPLVSVIMEAARKHSDFVEVMGLPSHLMA